MTAPTSPGVVPADDVRAAIEDYNVVWQSWPAAIDSSNVDQVRDAAMHAALMADRANRPSLTEDERRAADAAFRLVMIRAERAEAELEIRREALEFYRDNWLTLSDTEEPYEPNDMLWKDKGDIARRALADRSEPRQEMEGDRG